MVEAKYKGEGTAEYYRMQQVTVPPPQIMQGKMRPSTRLQPRLGVGSDGGLFGGDHRVFSRRIIVAVAVQDAH